MLDHASKLILVIDDATETAEAFEVILIAEGYRVAIAADGEEGLRLAAKLLPDVVLLDMMMPEVDGLQFLERLPGEVPPPWPVVIAASGFDRFKPLALKRGARAFVRKPVNGDELLALITSVLTKATLDRAALEAHERRVDSVREAAAATRATMWNCGILRDQVLKGDVRRLLDRLTGYFGIPKACLTAIKGENLIVFAQSSGPPHLSEVEPTPAEVTFCSDFVMAGASGVLPDTTAHPAYFDHLETLSGTRFYVGAAVVASTGITVGTLCMMDVIPHPFRAEDLAVLTGMAERAGSCIGFAGAAVPLGPPIVLPSGLFDRGAFELLTNAALRRVERDGGTVEVAVVKHDGGDITTIAGENTAWNVWHALGAKHVVVAEPSPDTISLTVDSVDSATVRERIDAGLDAMRRSARFRAAGVATFKAAPGSILLLSALDMVFAAERASRAAASSNVPVRVALGFP